MEVETLNKFWINWIFYSRLANGRHRKELSCFQKNLYFGYLNH